jgi:hypothetical protein
MADKIQLDDVGAGYNTNTINANFQTLKSVIDDQLLFRANPGAEDNKMLNNLDMNSYRLLNVEDGVDGADGVNLSQVLSLISSGGGAPGEGFLPLAGGEMNEGANIDWPGSTWGGSFSFGPLLGQDSFLWAPQNVTSGEIGYSWGAASGKILAYNSDGRYSLALLGRDLPVASLVDEDLITKANLDEATLGSDPVVTSIVWDHTTDVPTFGQMTATYESATLAGVLGGQAWTIQNDKTNIYSGFIFKTGGTDASVYNIEFAGGHVWLERPQNDTTNIPPGQALVTKDWVENFGPGGVEEAPVDGTPYARQDAGWVASATGITAGSNTWNVGGVQTHTAPLNYNGTFQYVNLGGVDTYVWTPASPSTENIGYNMTIDNTTNLTGGKATGWRITGQLFSHNDNIATVGHASSTYLPLAGGSMVGNINMQNRRITSLPAPAAGTDAARSQDLPAGWQLAKAAGAWLSTGSAEGTQRGASNPTKLGTGQYRINLSSGLTSTANATLAVEAFGALVGIDVVYVVLNTTQIQVNTVRSDTGAAIDVGCSYIVYDRGLA